MINLGIPLRMKQVLLLFIFLVLPSFTLADDFKSLQQSVSKIVPKHWEISGVEGVQGKRRFEINSLKGSYRVVVSERAKLTRAKFRELYLLGLNKVDKLIRTNKMKQTDIEAFFVAMELPEGVYKSIGVEVSRVHPAQWYEELSEDEKKADLLESKIQKSLKLYEIPSEGLVP